MTNRDRVVGGIELDLQSGGCTITYVTPKLDAKANGLLLNHSIAIPYSDDYVDEIDAVVDAIQALLDDVLEDFEALGPPESTPVENEDDEDDDD